MASFVPTALRRKLNKMMEKDMTPAALTITRPEGGVVLSKKEQQRYSWLFTIIDRCVVVGGVSECRACRDTISPTPSPPSPPSQRL